MWQIKPHQKGPGKPAMAPAPVRPSRFNVVERPPQHQGVGWALASAFPCGDEALPADMLALLDKLDR